MQGDSCRGVWSKAVPQLGDVSRDARMRPLPAMPGGAVAGAQWEHPIRVTTHRFGAAPRPEPQGL